MRMGTTFWASLFLSAAALPVWAQVTPPKKDEDKQEDTKAYYLTSREDDDIGWMSVEVGLDERGRIKIARTQQVPHDAVLDVRALIPPPSKELEGAQVEIQRTISLDEGRKMVEDHIRVTTDAGGIQSDGIYENGRWSTDVRVGRAPVSTIRSSESTPDDPPLLDFLYYAARDGKLVKDQKVKVETFDVDPKGAPRRIAYNGVVKETGSRPRYDGTDAEYVMMEIVVDTGAGAAVPPMKLYLTKDGFLDELQVKDLTYKRVTKDALGAIAGWLAGNRRDIFEESLADKNLTEVTPEDEGGKNPTVTEVQNEINAIRADMDVVSKEPDVLKRVDLVQGLLERLGRIQERKDITTMPTVQADINTLKDAIKRLLPRESLVDLAEGRNIANEILTILGKDTPDALARAEKKLSELQDIARRPSMVGSQEEPAMRNLVQESNFAIGRKALADYVKGFEVRGLVYHRADMPEQIRFGGSIFGSPMVLDESVHILRPRGLCLLKKGDKVKTYREGDPLPTTSEVTITVKSVLQDRVILEGRGAEIDLEYPPKDK